MKYGAEPMFIKRWIIILTAMFLLPSANLGEALQQAKSDATDSLVLFMNRWETDSGSRYEIINGEMICTSVHNKKYTGWIGKAALKNFHEKMVNGMLTRQ
jgi:hypothetical protein